MIVKLRCPVCSATYTIKGAIQPPQDQPFTVRCLRCSEWMAPELNEREPVMSRPYVCYDCGVLVFRKDFHRDFHERFRETTRILRLISERLLLIDGSPESPSPGQTSL